MASVEPDAAALHPIAPTISTASANGDDKGSPARQPAGTASKTADTSIGDGPTGNADKKAVPGEQQAQRTQRSSTQSATSKKKRSSVGSMSKPAVLAPEVIRNILSQCDPESFASATLVSRRWRLASDDPKLYAHHLSKTPSYLSSDHSSSPFLESYSLAELKQRFAREAKKLLYVPFICPRITTISLISEAPLSSFAAGPGGEKFEFTFSHSARWCLAVSSSRIYVINLSGTKEVEVTKELKVLRRPLAADILSDGSVMAVLSSDHSVSLYSIAEDGVNLKRSVDLDNSPYAIAMSPGGEILAAAFDGGVELCSLGEGTSPLEKRSVKTHRVDKVMFSRDGSVLLGTTQGRDPATVILTAPYFSAAEFDLPHSELVNSMWTRQILFPASSRDCSHSALLPRHGDDDSNWTLTYDRTYESFRAVRTDDLRNGTTYFTGPQTGANRPVVWPKDALVPTTLPSITAKGDLVAAGFKGSEVWLYGVPESLDAVQAPRSVGESIGQAATTQSGTGDQVGEPPREDSPPRWQMLVDKHQNVFSKGKKVADVSDISAMCWFQSKDSTEDSETAFNRLIVAAPGGVGSDTSLEEVTPIDGGRIVILDFSLQARAGKHREKTIEIGLKEPELLEEQKTDMETEIARVRRRTMAQRDSRVKSVLDALRPDNALEDVPEVPPLPGMGAVEPQPQTDQANDVSDDEEPGVTLEEAAAFVEGPYSHASPRSRTALYRSATVNQASRRRVEQARQPAPPPPIPMRRQDGTEVPDESDADNWVPPPPPYQRHADELLPDSLVQRALLYNGIAPVPSTAESMVGPRRSSSLNDGQRSHRRRSSVEVDILAHHLRRPIRQPSETSLGGDVSNVSSVSVTPRSSIRRRPLTMYQSSSGALRDSGIRDIAMSRSGSQVSRSMSINSASARISRSESLRRTSRGGAESGPVTASTPAISEDSDSATALNPAASSIEHQSDERSEPLLPATFEEQENISPAEQPSPQSDFEIEEETGLELSPQSNAVVSPEVLPDEMDGLPKPVDTEISAPVHTERESDAPEARVEQRQSLQREPSPVRDEMPQQQDNGNNVGGLMRADEAQEEGQAEEQDRGREPSLDTHPAFPIASLSLADYQLPESNTSGNENRRSTRHSPPIPPDQAHVAPAQELHANSIAQELPVTSTAHESLVDAAVPEPSAYQLAALQNRPRPHARQLSGGSPARARAAMPPLAVNTAVSAAAPAELADTPQTPRRRNEGTSRRLSKRLRGAMRRGDTEPMPELPQVPQLLSAVEQPTSGPARHSRMYANSRNNASEPVLRTRPPAQRLDTIQSINNEQLRNAGAGGLSSTNNAKAERPVVRRRLSIFSRRKSKDASQMRGHGSTLGYSSSPPPPVPTVPASFATTPHMSSSNTHAQGRPQGLRAAQAPAPALNRRSMTERAHQQMQFPEYFPGGPPIRAGGRQAYAADEGNLGGGNGRTGRGGGKNKDKDSKCSVM